MNRWNSIDEMRCKYSARFEINIWDAFGLSHLRKQFYLRWVNIDRFNSRRNWCVLLEIHIERGKQTENNQCGNQPTDGEAHCGCDFSFNT